MKKSSRAGQGEIYIYIYMGARDFWRFLEIFGIFGDFWDFKGFLEIFPLSDEIFERFSCCIFFVRSDFECDFDFRSDFCLLFDFDFWICFGVCVGFLLVFSFSFPSMDEFVGGVLFG